MCNISDRSRSQSSSLRCHPWKSRKSFGMSNLFWKNSVGPSTPFRFDVLAQQANLPTRITLYELLRLFKSIGDALKEALTYAEVFVSQIPTTCQEEDGNHCHHTSKQFPCITFTLEDMQIKRKHDRPLYYIAYIRSSKVNHIQVDPGSALIIIPRRVMQHLGIPTDRLSTTQTIIYDFNVIGMRPMGKIKLRCQIGDLKS